MIIDSPAVAYSCFCEIATEDQETLVAAFLDVKNRVIATEEIFRGSLDSTCARPREILRAALKVNAGRLIIAHNHPTGCPEPSDEDVIFTVRLERASEIVGIELLDHLVIGGEGEYFSFAEARLLGQDCPRTERKRTGPPPHNPPRFL